MNSRRQLDCASYLSPGGVYSPWRASYEDDSQGECVGGNRMQLKGSRTAMQTQQANTYSFG